MKAFQNHIQVKSLLFELIIENINCPFILFFLHLVIRSKTIVFEICECLKLVWTIKDINTKYLLAIITVPILTIFSYNYFSLLS